MARRPVDALVIAGATACVLTVLVYAGFAAWYGVVAPTATRHHHAFVRQRPPGLEIARQFDRLFADARHSVSYGAAASGGSTPLWNCRAVLAGRYQLTMQVPMRVTSATSGEAAGPPGFWLNEIVSVTGRATSFGRQWTFGPDEWERLVRADGDFSAIGIELRRDAPVPGAEHLLHP